jgi:selenide,water dikinase
MANMGMIPAGSFANRKYCENSVTVKKGVDTLLVDCMADAQTSGGLLIAVPEEHAEALHKELGQRDILHPEVGQVASTSKGRIRILP